MEKIHPAFRESLEEAEEELFLLRCALRCMMEEERSRELESLRLRPRWGQRRIFHAFPHLHAGRHQEAVEKLREYWKSRK